MRERVQNENEKNESARYTYARAGLRTARMARSKKAAQKKQCDKGADVRVLTEQTEQVSEPKRKRKLVGARQLRKQLFRKERVRTHDRITKECAAQTCASDDEVSAVDASPGASVHAVFGAREREHEEYVDVSVQDDEGWQEQRPSRRRVYDACAWADACLENVCEARESGASDAEMVETDFLGD